VVIASHPKSILCAHRFFDVGQDALSYSKDYIAGLGYRAVVLGHDHAPSDPVTVLNTEVIRPGALSRGTSHHMNLVRGVQVATFDPTENTFGLLDVPVQPAEQVFAREVFDKASSFSRLTHDISLRVEELVDRLSVTSSASIYTYLDGVNAEPSVKGMVESALKRRGIFREEKV
jgi:hypothetical protein